MKILNINSQGYIKSISYDDTPIIYISKIRFLTNDKNWVSRLENVLLNIKLICIDSKGKKGDFYMDYIDFGNYVTPMHRPAIVEVHRTIKYGKGFENTHHSKKIPTCKTWEVEFELNNISLQKDESVEIEYLDRKYILEQITDWSARIHGLYSEIQKWFPRYSLKIGLPVKMNEELMPLFEIAPYYVDTIDIYNGSDFVLAIKPVGLWVIGVNGRIDLLSKKGSYMLVDHAPHFQPPQWYIYSTINKLSSKPLNQQVREGIPLSKEAFLNIM